VFVDDIGDIYQERTVPRNIDVLSYIATESMLLSVFNESFIVMDRCDGNVVEETVEDLFDCGIVGKGMIEIGETEHL
jgi:hypothetical protein